MASPPQASLLVPFFQQQTPSSFLCHILIILTFQTFSLLLYLLEWSLISDLWCHYYNYFVATWTTPIYYCCCCCCYVTSIESNSVRPYGQQPTRLFHPQDSPGKNTGVGCHFLLHHIIQQTVNTRHVLMLHWLAIPSPLPLSLGLSTPWYRTMLKLG